MIYLDNAATSRFKPFRCVCTQLFFALKSANPGRSAHKDAIRAALAVEKARVTLSDYHSGMRVVFTKNCTEALCLAVRGLKLRGVALVSPFEHNAVLRTLEREAEHGLQTKLILPDPQGNVTVKEVQAALTPDTKLVVLSKMSNVTGGVVDEARIGKLLRSRGILFLLDTAQSAGHLGVDCRFVDIIASSGHKGLHGPAGTGYLAFQPKIFIEPLLTGGTGSSTLSLKHPTEYPDAYEAGTQNAGSIAALGKAAEWTFLNGKRIYRRINGLSRKLYNGLSSTPGVTVYSSPAAPFVTFTVKGLSSNKVAEILSERYGIAVRAGLHCAPLAHKFLHTEKEGAVRASVGCRNRTTHIAKLLRAVRTMAKSPEKF